MTKHPWNQVLRGKKDVREPALLGRALPHTSCHNLTSLQEPQFSTSPDLNPSPVPDSDSEVFILQASPAQSLRTPPAPVDDEPQQSTILGRGRGAAPAGPRGGQGQQGPWVQFLRAGGSLSGLLGSSPGLPNTRALKDGRDLVEGKLKIDEPSQGYHQLKAV